MSSHFLPRTARDGNIPRPDLPREPTALPNTASVSITTIRVTLSDTVANSPPSNTTADNSKLGRPLLVRTAFSAVAIVTNTPAFVWPLLHRAQTTYAVRLHNHSSRFLGYGDDMSTTRGDYIGRATQALSNQLEFADGSSKAHRYAPAKPSYWDDQVHRRYLVQVWDTVNEIASKSSKHPKSASSHLVVTQQNMLKRFPELSGGNCPMSRDWMEYVLGVALRHPFCTADSMGRWELLAASGGARGTWGPW